MKLCARCNKDTRIAAGQKATVPPSPQDNELYGSFSYQGYYGSYRYDFEVWQAELCESCCEKVRNWIDKGAGEGVRTVNLLDIDDEVAGGSTIPHPGAPGWQGYRQKFFNALRRRGFRRPC